MIKFVNFLITFLTDKWSLSIDDWINIREVNYNSWTFKFDHFSEFQNVISGSQSECHYGALHTKIGLWLTPNNFIKVCYFCLTFLHLYSYYITLFIKRGFKITELLKKFFFSVITETLLKIIDEIIFTTSETELDYYHQKVNVWVASRVAERLKT